MTDPTRLPADGIFVGRARTSDASHPLVVTVRDRRAFGDAVSGNNIFRQDEKYGSNFVQEVSPNKTFPVITQSLTFDHSL